MWSRFVQCEQGYNSQGSALALVDAMHRSEPHSMECSGVSIEALTHIRNMNLSARGLKHLWPTLNAVADNADANGVCTVPQVVLTYEAGHGGVRTTSRHLAELCAEGILEKRANFTDFGGRRPDTIRILGVDPEDRPPTIQILKDRFLRSKIPATLRRAVMERDDFRCRHCNSRHNLGIDHRTPLSRGGATSLENLQLLCGPCNSRKGASVA